MRRDDDEDFTAFVAGSSHRLLRTAFLLTGDRGAAEDLLQVALERAYRRWPRVRGMASPEAYVRRALINAATDRWRHRHGVIEEALDLDRLVADDTDVVAARDEVFRAVRLLPVGQRAVLVLRYFDDLTEVETADVLGCTVGTVKSQHARAIARLRELLPAERLS